MSTASASSVPIDLSRLPAPRVIAPLSFEQIFSDIVADFRGRVPGFDALLESDPVMGLLEAAAYRELLTRATVNDSARAVMLAFASGGDLDHLAAYFGVERLTIVPATDTTPAVLESDADLRTRVQLAPELLSDAGRTVGGYRAIALRVAPSLKDVALVKRGGGVVDVVLLGRTGDGAVDAATVSAVGIALRDDGATQLTDIVAPRSAAIVTYSVSITLRIRFGPDPELVRAEAERAVRVYAAERHRIGLPIYAQMLASAASVGGVEQAIVDPSFVDLVPSPVEAPWLAGLAITAVPA